MGVADYFKMENRFRMLSQSKPDEASGIFDQAQVDADRRRKRYEFLASRNLNTPAGAQS
jgi:hypothetical protein